MKNSILILCALLSLSMVSCGKNAEKENSETGSASSGAAEPVMTETLPLPAETEPVTEPETTVPVTEPESDEPVPGLPNLYPEQETEPETEAESFLDGAPVVIIPLSGSGQFTSEGNKNLQLCVDWSYTLNPDRRGYVYDVTLSVSLSHYELYAGAKPDAGIVTFADSGTLEGSAYSFSTPAISYDGEERTETLLFEKTYPLEFAHAPVFSVPVSVVWDIQIAYGGEQIDGLTAEGVILIEEEIMPID